MLINEHHAEFSLLIDTAPIVKNDKVFLFKGSDVLLRTGVQESRLPFWGDAADVPLKAPPRHAFAQGSVRFFIANVADDAIAPVGLAWENMRVFRSMLPELDALLLNTARHLSVWYGSHRFCSNCGHPTRPHDSERALTCDTCGYVQYPSVHPAIIVALTDRDRLLLARNASGVFRKFSLLAGFVEVGESAEQAVAREVLEEVGLHIQHIRYLKSQPWGISQSLMLGFSAELDGPAEICLQETELAEARWFTRDNVPMHDSTVSIASHIMDLFQQGKL